MEREVVVSPVVDVLVPSADVEVDLLGALMEEFRNFPRVCDFAGGGEVVADGGGPERNLPRRGGGGAVVVPSAFSAIVKSWLLVDNYL